ncbi:MAG: hypothetical protein ACJ8AW_23635 [Rhodopila sp.]
MCPRCFRLKVAEFDSLRPPRRLPGRFRERVWPVFWRERPKRDARLPLPSPCHAKWDRSLEKAIRLEIARRWMPQSPLERQWDLIDEAIRPRGTVA